MAVDLAFSVQGNGPALLIMHGLFGSSSNWRSVANHLTKNHRVITVDLRNHGDSPHADIMGYPEMAEDVLRLLDHLGLEQAGLLGHSMGGKVAMYAALAFPNRVRHLIVADIAPVSYRRDYTRLIAAMRGVNLEAIESRSDADQVLKAAGTDESLRPFLLKNLKRDGQHFNWRINLDGIAHNLSTLLSFPEVAIYPPYSEPTMLIRGELSDFVLPEHRSTIQQYFPRARFVTVKEAGHWLHVERPYGFMGAVDTFLKLAY